MKREYQKPFLAVDLFQLDAAIAGACDLESGKIAINHQVNTCDLDGTGGDLVVDRVFGGACEMDVVNSDTCYHAFAANLTYLSS